MIKYLVIYHNHCVDGFCSAWLHHRYCIQHSVTEPVEYYAANYQEAPPLDKIDENTRVIILDFSYPALSMQLMCDKAKSVTLLDHHKTAFENIGQFVHPHYHGILDNDKSGAMLTSEFFDMKHWIVPFVQDRDLWQWKLPYSKEVSAGLNLIPFQFDAWDRLWDETYSLAKLISDGTAIVKYQKELIDRIVARAKSVIIGGVEGLGVDNSVLVSEVGEALAIKSGTFGACYFVVGDDLSFSLRSRNGFDVSEICKKYKGGGHLAAAGFKLSNWQSLPSEMMICQNDSPAG